MKLDDTLQTQQGTWGPQDGPIVFLIDGSGLGAVLLILFFLLTWGMIIREGGSQ